MGILDFVPIIGKVLDRVIPDPAAKAAAQLQLMQLAQNGELAQLTAETDLAKGQVEVDKTEAASGNTFQSGWRPFVGWVCGMGLMTQFLIAPLATWIADMLGYHIVFPALDMGTLMTLLFGMLGLGAMRMQEKINGVASK
jgi:hypothetical protein